jgi:hypothetical protein
VQPLVRSVGLRNVEAVARRDRLDTLPLVAHQPKCVLRKVLAPLRVLQHTTNQVDEASESLFGGFVDVHVKHLITARSARQCAPTRGTHN